MLFSQHFPGGAAPGRATGWWCGLWDSRRRCTWPGYWLVVRPVGFPAALRLAGLLAGGAACGIPGGAAPGLATRWWCGLWDSRRRCAWTGYWLVVRPAGFPAALRLAGLLVVRPAGWVARARHLCRPREGLQGPYAKKARTFVRALISNMAVRGD
ncbi:TPA: hypothetical protein ACHBXM_004628 [Klebsiella aerogenes]